MIHSFLDDSAQVLSDTFMEGVQTQADWQKRKSVYKEEYLYMLGLSPMPEKTPLRDTVTSTLKGDGYEVETVHFQSSPGLYVTGNLYRPVSKKQGEKLPAILYVCGHANRGRNGNKTAYQSNGIWFARHGYVCLMIDTLQRGEVAGIHHGTYRENLWWWHSRGYTSAGVECWNGIRSIDYLSSRPDVDPERIGVTGISGGGAATFWIAAADERVKAAVPISGMADLPSYIADQVIDEHCDCMFLHNTYQWPWTRIGGLIAPRPLLFVNSDHDIMFPMNANERVSNRLETIYSLFGAGDQIDSLVSIGGHAYREDVRRASFRFMNIHLKSDPRPVTDSEVDLVTGKRGEEIHPIPPETLRVFPKDSDLPKDELNSTIDRHFVPVAKVETPELGAYGPWRESLVEELRAATFRSFPQRIPMAKLKRIDASGAMVLETEPGIEARARNIQSHDSAKRILLIVNTEEDDRLRKLESIETTDTVYICDSRGVGMTRWSTRNPPNFVARSHALIGRTVDDGRVWDLAAVARFLEQRHEGKAPVYIAGKGAGAVLAAYAMLLEPAIEGALLDSPILSHMHADCPPLLNVLRVCDVPDVLGSLAPRQLSLRGINRREIEKIARIYEAASSADKLRRH